MPTHQEIAQVSDEEMLQRMIDSHDGRFDDTFWAYFESKVKPHLPERPCVADLGCGPGLFLRDLGQRHGQCRMFGVDVTRAMLDYARTLDYTGEAPAYHEADIAGGELPLSANSIDLVTMVAVYHVLNDPLAVARELHRVLAPGGIFLLQDWVRTSLPEYLERMGGDVPPEAREKARERMLRLFPSHNKYTVEDWLWLLGEAGFEVLDYEQLGSPHFRTFVCKAAT